MPNLGADFARLIVLPLPLIVTTLRIPGSPVGNAKLVPGGTNVLLTVVSVCVLFLGNTIVSAPLPFRQLPLTVVSLFAAVMALAREHVPRTLMVVANAGA
jgi:hypothetical protein